jgi:adenylate cyclase
LAIGERRLAAVMFTDIVGYTALAQKDEALAIRLLSEHNRLLRSLFPEFNGREVKTIGDSFLVEFPSALEAVQCAFSIQKVLHERNGGSTAAEAILVRIGVHVGDVIHAEGDILGDAVNISSRIRPLAHPGGICISGQAYDQVRNKVELRFHKMEKQALKNITLPIDVYSVLLPWAYREAPREATVADRRRIAVLPLLNISPDPKDEYFADGMTEELISTLSRISGISVISRTSVMKYRNTDKTVAEIGKELNAGMVLEGSVRKSGNRVRTAVQLIDVAKDDHLWAQSYDRDLEDVFAVQSDVAERVAGALQVQLLTEVKDDLGRKATDDVEAYTLYLKGRVFWNQRSEEGIQRAIECFREATVKDPDYALGYAGLADCYYLIGANQLGEPAANYAKAREFVIKALNLDEKLAEAHTTLAALMESRDFDFEGAESEFKRAIVLKPSYSTAHHWYSLHLRCLGRMAGAAEEAKKAVELDPLSPIIGTNYAETLFDMKEYDESMETLAKIIEAEPSFGPAHEQLFVIYVQRGKFDEALRERDALVAINKGRRPITAKANLAYAYAYMGRKEEARALLAEVEAHAKEELLSYFDIAGTYFKLGDVDKGFQLLERSYEERERFIAFLRTPRELDGVRTDPRYLSLIKRVGI